MYEVICIRGRLSHLGYCNRLIYSRRIFTFNQVIRFIFYEHPFARRRIT